MARVSGYVRQNVLGMVAIFLALNAGAYAVTTNDSGGTAKTVFNQDLGSGSVDSRVLASGAVQGVDIHSAAVGPKKLKLDKLVKYLQTSVSATCDPGQSIQGILADGSVICVDDQSNPGTITGITTGGGLTGGGTSGDVALGIDPSLVQTRVTGSCSGNNAVQSVGQGGAVTCQPTGTGTVTSVGSGTGLTGGPITSSGALSVDPSQVQTRVTGSCGGTQALQSVNQNGTVNCSSSLQTAGHVLTPAGFQINAGTSQTLFSANGIQVTAVCTGAGNPEVTIGPTSGGTTVNYAANSAASANAHYGLEVGSATASQTISVGTGVLGDHVYFDALLNVGGKTLSGSFQSYPNGAPSTGCVYSGTAEAS